jgi:hypothetical protein
MASEYVSGPDRRLFVPVGGVPIDDDADIYITMFHSISDWEGTG